MKLTNKFHLPQALVDAVPPARPFIDGETSVTRLFRPPQINYLEYAYWDELTEDVSDLIYALLGTAVHQMLERTQPANAFTEERLSCDFSGFKLTGTSDLLEGHPLSDGHRLDDYKVTSVYKATVAELSTDWINQLMGYSFLWAEAGFTVEQQRVVALLRDFSLPERKRRRQRGDDSYPEVGVVVLDLSGHIPPANRWADIIAENIIGYQQAIDGKYRECIPTERWERPSVWAVNKCGRKSAVRLLPSEREAGQWLDDNGCSPTTHSIQERKGESVRCQDYCRAAPFCSQYRAIREAQGDRSYL